MLRLWLGSLIGRWDRHGLPDAFYFGGTSPLIAALIWAIENGFGMKASTTECKLAGTPRGQTVSSSYLHKFRHQRCVFDSAA